MPQNIRTAQFGGVGGAGSGSPFAPGKSPIGTGGKNPGGWDINASFDEDMNFEKLLSRTHPDLDNSDRNFESRLTPQHQHVEELKNYFLTPQERLREKFRRELHNYKKSLEDHADNLKKNSVEYIKLHFQPKEEHMMTMEMSLGKRRKYDDTKIVRHKYEDEVPEQIKPERIHPVFSSSEVNRIAQISSRNRLTDEEPPGTEERNQFDIAKYTRPPLGRAPVLINGDELEQYFSELRQEAAPNDKGQRENADTDTVLTLPDPDYKANVHPRNEIANEPADDGVNEIDLFIPLEQNLHPKKTPKNYYDRNNMGNEDMGVEEVYPGSAFFGIHTPASFQSAG